jgi:hypothetical protein
VSTQLAANGFTTAVGDGSIGEIDLPGGGSTVSVNDRGDLGSIQGPTTAGLSGASALDLVFMDLTGSISGLDTIESIQASGWLGTSASQVVDVNRGMGSLSAYGVGATVNTDLFYSVTDALMQLNVGDGGVPGIINAGNVGNAEINGNVNDITIQDLEGTYDPPQLALVQKELTIDNTKDNPPVILGAIGLLNFTEAAASVQEITAGYIGVLKADNLTVSDFIQALRVGTVTTTGGLDLGFGTLFSAAGIGKIQVGGSLRADVRGITGGIQAIGSIGSLFAGDGLIANVCSWNGNVGPITVDGGIGFRGLVRADVGNTGPIRVTGGDFSLGSPMLVYAGGAVGPIDITGGDLGSATIAADIVGQRIDVINVQDGPVGPANAIQGGNIFLSDIKATNGSIKGVLATAVLGANVTAVGGNVMVVSAATVTGNIRAEGKVTTDPTKLQGGSIGLVRSENAIGAISISADAFIYKVEVTGAGNMLAQITAQGGGQFIPGTGIITGGMPLNLVLAGGGTFQGTVNFTWPAVAPFPFFFSNGSTLLSLVDGSLGAPPGTTPRKWWTLKGPPGSEGVDVKATFGLVRGILAWNQAASSFTSGGKAIDGWTIVYNGPAPPP